MTTMNNKKISPTTRFTVWIAACAMLAVAGQAHAGWQTPAEAMQIAAVDTPAAAQNVTVKGQPAFFTITNDDVAAAVASQLQGQGFRDGVKATVNPGNSPVIASADHPLKVVIHALQVDTDAKLWQGQAYIMDGDKTESMKPVAGRYDSVLTVPVLTRQLRKGDVIELADIEMRKIPERQLRKDSVTVAAQVVGKSPLRIISPGRPMRLAEISSPTMVKKGQTVEMLYTTPYMTIRTTGEALEDGSQNAMVRVQNLTSQKAVSGRVVAAGQIEVNSESAL